MAFVSLPLRGASGSAARFLLVDAQGVLLDPPPRAQFAFPVLTGLTDEQTEAERRVRVRAMQNLMDDLGPAGQNISEINAAAPDDLTVVAQVEGRPLELKLGDGNYAKRLQNFLLHYPEIRKHAANVTTFDLRLDDRITAKEQPNQDELRRIYFDAVGLDAGSAWTRCVICRLEGQPPALPGVRIGALPGLGEED